MEVILMQKTLQQAIDGDKLQASLVIQNHGHFNLNELMAKFLIDWQTAKHVSREFSRVVRQIRGGVMLMQSQKGFCLGSKIVSDKVVELLDDVFGIEWEAVN